MHLCRYAAVLTFPVAVLPAIASAFRRQPGMGLLIGSTKRPRRFCAALREKRKHCGMSTTECQGKRCCRTRTENVSEPWCLHASSSAGLTTAAGQHQTRHLKLHDDIHEETTTSTTQVSAVFKMEGPFTAPLKQEWQRQFNVHSEATALTGGNANVYKAQLACDGSYLAIKRVSSLGVDERQSRDAKRACLHEVAIQSYLASKFVLAIHDFHAAQRETNSDVPLFDLRCDILLEYASVGTFADLSGKVTEKEAAGLAFELLQDIQWMHKMGIVHKDIKPSNVFVSGSHAKLGDFGESKYIGNDPRFANLFGVPEEENYLNGTPVYLPPEIFQSLRNGASKMSVKNVSITAMDVWAAGITIFELVTGGRPAIYKNMDSTANRRYAFFALVGPVSTYRFAESPADLESIRLKASRPELVGLLTLLLARHPAERSLEDALAKARQWYDSLDGNVGQDLEAPVQDSCWVPSGNAPFSAAQLALEQFASERASI